MQRDRFEVADGWLATARQDLRLARQLTAEMPNVACFHAQQAAEKAVKAGLVAHAGDAARDHAIVALLAEAETFAAVAPALLDRARRLDKFYVATRYPDALGGLDPTIMFGESEATEAVGWAELVVAFGVDLVRVARESVEG
jgi:HEPN domain-containing protein